MTSIPISRPLSLPPDPEGPAPGGMEWRRIWSSDDAATAVIVREGWVPVSVGAGREPTLSYWARSDAEDARQRVAELIAEEGPLGPDPADLLEQLEAQADRLRLIGAQVQQLLQQRLLSPDDGVKILRDLSRAAVAPAVVAELVDQATNSIEATAAIAASRLDAIDQRVAAATEEMAALVDSTAEAIATTAGRLEAQHAEAMARGLAALAVRASDLRGPKGDPGPLSPGMGIGAGVPSGPEAAVPVLGRLAIAGDTIVDASQEDRPAYRFDGQTWERGPAMSQVLVRPVSIVGRTETSVAFAPGKPPEVSGGAEAFAPLIVTSNSGPVRIWDSSRWAAGEPRQAAHSCLMYLEAVSTMNGARGSALVNITETGQTGAFEFTVYAELGLFAGVIEPDVEALLAAVTPPAGATLPPGLPQALQVSVGLTGAVGAYALQGWILPSLEAQADRKQPTPAW